MINIVMILNIMMVIMKMIWGDYDCGEDENGDGVDDRR